MDSRCKNRRLCDKIKTKSCVSRKITSSKSKCSSTKTKTKKNCQSTFSMIKFYESIPSYDEVRHLPAYDFTERLNLLKKIHCDLSQPLVHRVHCGAAKPIESCHRGTSAKSKRDSPLKPCTISPSLCRTFSKTSLNDLDEIENNKQNRIRQLPNADSINIPTALKRLQLLRERLAASVGNEEFKPKLTSSMCSPIFSEIKMDCSPNFHDIDSHPCDLYFNNCHSNFGFEHKYPVSYRDVTSPPKQARNLEQLAKHCKQSVSSPTSIETTMRRRAKSCPKELFRTAKPCLNFHHDDEVPNTSSTKEQVDGSTPSHIPGECNSSVSSRQRSKAKVMMKTRPKTPHSFDEFLSSKMVRSNLAANLRQKWAHKKINEMTEAKLKATTTVAKCIPKCHRWNVRRTPAWKSFTAEDTQTEKRLREEARREEQRLRQHAHTMHMNIMRSRVESAQLLLEGRSLSAKS